jgi:energy-coupling factor transport system ATP-binding protein
MAEPVLLAERFEYRYPGRPEPALRGLDLALEPGSFTLLAGASGSGKSSLLRAACGLVPHFHGGEASGELRVGGLSVREHGPSALAAVCGTVFQDPESQIVMGGVGAEIALGLEHRDEPVTSVAREVEEVALALGIAGLLERRTDSLSGGELQRVAIAAALATRPALLVLDEPTSQLDPVAGDELIWLLRRLNEEAGTAVLLAEHRLERALGAADRVIALDGGRIACDGAPGDFLAWADTSAPGLATPLARLFSLAGLGPAPVSVKAARAGVEAGRLMPSGEGHSVPDSGLRRAPRRRGRRGRRQSEASGSPALCAHEIWHELRDGPAVLRGVDLRLDPGERIALLGRNGAGKSTLLRHFRGLLEPTRGRIERGGEVALLLQSPGDYLVHERVEEEAGAAGAQAAGLAGRAGAHPRDLSGGERQRLALEVVLGPPSEDGLGRPAAVLLDEPTRGMDRLHQEALAARLSALADAGAAVVVATHDTEFAAAFAERAVLMGKGTVIADGPAAEVLAGGRHFTTDVARALGGAGGALTPEAGAEILTRELVSQEVHP